MGHERHSYDDMMKTRSARVASAGDAFAYDRHVRTTGRREIHASVNPAHGGKRHIAEGELLTVCFDVTGSYASVPRVVQGDLPELFGRLVLNSWVPDKLNVQYGAIGDAYSDRAPLQLSQAEPDGTTADEWLSNLYLEGGGGGGNHESYGEMFWALCNQNDFAGWREGRKGNAFIIFDEKTYPQVSARKLREIYTNRSNSTLDDGGQLSERMMRDSLDAGEDSVVLPDTDISIEDMARELQDKYDVWCIMIKGTGYWQNPDNLRWWRGLFGEQNVILLEDAENVSELISGLMAAKYAAVSMGAVTSTLDTSIVGSTDMATIRGAMKGVAALPPTVDFRGSFGALGAGGGGSDKNMSLPSGSDNGGADRL